MATLREMIDVPDQIMGLQEAVGLTIHAGGPGSGRRPYAVNSPWHMQMKGVLKSHGFKNTGGGTINPDNSRGTSEYQKHIGGNKMHTVTLDHDDGTWSHSTTNFGKAESGSRDKWHNSAMNRNSGASGLDKHLSS